MQRSPKNQDRRALICLNRLIATSLPWPRPEGSMNPCFSVSSISRIQRSYSGVALKGSAGAFDRHIDPEALREVIAAKCPTLTVGGMTLVLTCH